MDNHFKHYPHMITFCAIGCLLFLYTGCDVLEDETGNGNSLNVGTVDQAPTPLYPLLPSFDSTDPHPRQAAAWEVSPFKLQLNEWVSSTWELDRTEDDPLTNRRTLELGISGAYWEFNNFSSAMDGQNVLESHKGRTRDDFNGSLASASRTQWVIGTNGIHYERNSDYAPWRPVWPARAAKGMRWSTVTSDRNLTPTRHITRNYVLLSTDAITPDKLHTGCIVIEEKYTSVEWSLEGREMRPQIIFGRSVRYLKSGIGPVYENHIYDLHENLQDPTHIEHVYSQVHIQSGVPFTNN